MSGGPALLIRDLRFGYNAEAPSIVDIGSLRLERGEQMLLRGGSGRGKSTLLYLIAGLLEPQSGSVEISGKAIHSMRGAARDLYRGRTVGMIFQTFNLLHGFTALENVMAAMMFSSIPRSEHADRAAQLLKGLGIERTGADPDRLSVGQQQRVAVARAVACDPVLVLADEPTASLDPENAEGAVRLIQETCLRARAALLCVSHDPSLTSKFDRVESLEALHRAAVAKESA